MQTAAIRTVANSLPQNEVILLTLLISKRYIPYTDLRIKNVVLSLFVLHSYFCLKKCICALDNLIIDSKFATQTKK